MHLVNILELWLEWLKDEMPLECIPEQREKLISLFDRAVKDYQCKSISFIIFFVNWSISERERNILFGFLCDAVIFYYAQALSKKVKIGCPERISLIKI